MKKRKIFIIALISILTTILIYLFLVWGWGFSMKKSNSNVKYYEFFDKTEVLGLRFNPFLSSLSTKIQIITFEEKSYLKKINIKKLSDSLIYEYKKINIYSPDTILFKFKLSKIDTTFVYQVK